MSEKATLLLDTAEDNEKILEKLCPECIVHQLSRTGAMCLDCYHVNCGYKCSVTGKRIKSEQPFCEDWECDHENKCTRAYISGEADALGFLREG